jgi:hypothetical protein
MFYGGAAALPHSGCLDLYTWLTWRCYQSKELQRIPLFGPAGLASLLGVEPPRY